MLMMSLFVMVSCVPVDAEQAKVIDIEVVDQDCICDNHDLNINDDVASSFTVCTRCGGATRTGWPHTCKSELGLEGEIITMAPNIKETDPIVI